ncbi:hypothetical protein GCM10017083_33120 [Thalassobaculum fulvum]|jgi:hypothetical protein|uniref:Uncharacterized protein n=1 Tax=Thalassobaculum fulvum TaxID=1633335 RepID=A0A918XTK2_9PROT|nr:hypothetical protein [Thalassobaculum fulvum]GHD54815.1 hypothetical protein GCM10017083_33120 [Thalassobaculum fulvum]
MAGGEVEAGNAPPLRWWRWPLAYVVTVLAAPCLALGGIPLVISIVSKNLLPFLALALGVFGAPTMAGVTLFAVLYWPLRRVLSSRQLYLLGAAIGLTVTLGAMLLAGRVPIFEKSGLFVIFALCGASSGAIGSAIFASIVGRPDGAGRGREQADWHC